MLKETKPMSAVLGATIALGTVFVELASSPRRCFKRLRWKLARLATSNAGKCCAQKWLGLVTLSALVFPVSACDLIGPDNQPPVVSITQPSFGAVFTVGQQVPLAAEASDSDGMVASVAFYVGDRLLGMATDSPYTLTWNTAGEEHLVCTIRAVAADDDGALSEASVRVRVNYVYTPPEQSSDEWQTASLEDVGMDPTPFVDLINRLRGHNQHRVHGIVLARHGMLVFEHYFSGLTHPTWGETPVTFTRDTPHVLSSVTKSFTAVLLGIAIDHGFITGLDDRVLQFYPELADLETDGREQMTLDHLVNMASGLAWNETVVGLTDPTNHLTAFINRALTTSDDLVRFVLEKSMVADPGTLYNYSGGNTNVIGDIVRQGTGMRLDQFATQYLFAPLGIDRTWWWVLRPDFVYASGDLALVPRDMARFGQLFLQDGRWNGQQIISERWIRLAAEPVFLFSEPYWALDYGMVGYSHGWWPNDTSYGAGAFSASGWGGQQIIVMPELDMVAAITGGSYWVVPYMTTHQIMLYVLSAVR